MTAPALPRRTPRRVYYGIAVATLALALIVLSIGLARVRPARAQVDVSIEPTMTKGPASARVTIFEFSDYQ